MSAPPPLVPLLERIISPDVAVRDAAVQDWVATLETHPDHLSAMLAYAADPASPPALANAAWIVCKK